MQAAPCILLTRAEEDNAPVAQALRDRGVVVRALPCTAVRLVCPPAAPGHYDAVAFTSRWGVRGFVAAGLRVAALAEGTLVAVVGSATAEEAERHGIRVDLVADPQTGEALAVALEERLPAGAEVLVPGGTLPGGGLLSALCASGRPADALVVYENLVPDLPRLAPFPVAAVFVAAPSAAARLLAALPWLVASPFLAIGPTTLARLGDLGVHDARQIGTALDVQVETLEAAWRAACPSFQR